MKSWTLTLGYWLAAVVSLWGLAAQPLHAQPADSLGWRLYKAGEASAHAGQAQTALPFLHRAQARAMQHPPQLKLQAYCAIALGYAHADLGNADSTIHHYQAGLRLARQLGHPILESAVCNNLGNFYEDLGQFPQALRYLQQALQALANQPDQQAQYAMILLNLGALYGRMGERTTSVGYTRRSIAVLESCRCDTATLANAYFNLATDTIEAATRLQLFERAYTLARLTPDSALQMATGAAYAKNLADADRNADALHVLQTCNRIAASVQIPYYQALVELAWSHFHLKQGNVPLGARQARLAYDRLTALGNLDGRRQALQLLYRSDSLLGNYRAALEHYRLLRDVQDSLRSESKARELGRIEAQFEAQQTARLREAQLAAERSRTHWLLGSVCGVLLFVGLLALTLLRSRNRERRVSTQMRRLYHEVELQRTEIEAMNAELRSTLEESQNQEKRLTEQHEKIEDSLRYASRIQQAILPAQRFLDTFLPPHFIHYQPRDIISGDFYWMARTEGKTLFAAVDCTGHGVPGAFMSVMGHNLLNQIVNEMGIDRPATVLKSLDSRIVRTLGQDRGLDTMNGMDVCLVVIHDADAEGNRVVEYAGAGRPLWVLANGAITEFRSARYPCGGGQHPNKAFPANRLDLKPGMRLYLFSDGITDQFGGVPRAGGLYRKLGRPRLRLFLEETSHLPLPDQQEAFVDFFARWMGDQKPLDDVLLACIEL